jgi:hypothetical protein
MNTNLSIQEAASFILHIIFSSKKNYCYASNKSICGTSKAQR